MATDIHARNKEENLVKELRDLIQTDTNRSNQAILRYLTFNMLVVSAGMTGHDCMPQFYPPEEDKAAELKKIWLKAVSEKALSFSSESGAFDREQFNRILSQVAEYFLPGVMFSLRKEERPERWEPPSGTSFPG